MALSATLNTLKDRLQMFSSEADTLTAICSSKMAKGRSAGGWSSTIVSTATTKLMRPPSSRPLLPTEILDSIFSCLGKRDLEPLLITNSFVSAVATRRLYHDVTLYRAGAIVLFLRTILANPRLPHLVRSLDINMTKPLTPGAQRPRPTGNFYLLLQRALQAMTALTALALELPKAHTPLWIFSGATFRLRTLTTSMYCRRPLACFLEQQDMLEELTLRGYQTDAAMFLPFVDHGHGAPVVPLAERFVLSDAALPRLRVFNAVHADPGLIRAVVQGRPVDVVSVPLFPDMSVASLDALQAASVPLRRLSVISFDPTAPGFLFEALAQRFVHLEALHLVMLMAEYNQELLEQSGVVLSNFKCLKYITFMAAPTRPPPLVFHPPPPQAIGTANATATAPQPSEDDSVPALDAGEADIARRWHRHCPTLRTIILPKGRVWFQNTDGQGAELAPLGGAVATAAPGVGSLDTLNTAQSQGGGGGEGLNGGGGGGEWVAL